jgi:crescentin
MALNGKALGNGWLDQATRLAAAHGTWGGRPIAQAPSSPIEAPDFDAAAGEREGVLADALELAQAKIADLENLLAQDAATKQSLSSQSFTLSAQLQAAEKRIADLQVELTAAHDDLSLRDNENQSLQNSLDLAMTENAALTQRLAASGTASSQTDAQREYLQTALAAADAECARLGGEAEKSRLEAGALNSLLETMSERAKTAERLLADARECLAARVADSAVIERNLAGATAARRNAENELRQVEDLLRLKQHQVNELEQSRHKLLNATNALLKTCQGRDAALVRADDEIKHLQERIARLEAQARAAQSRQAAREAAAPVRQAVLRAAVAGDDTRKKWAELAGELAKLAKLKRAPSPLKAGATPSLLASTITF